MNERSAAREILLALLTGVACWFGVKAAQRLEDPYSEPRLTVDGWFQRATGGGDHA